MATQMRTSRIIDALSMAHDHRHFQPLGCIFHSDRDSPPIHF